MPHHHRHFGHRHHPHHPHHRRRHGHGQQEDTLHTLRMLIHAGNMAVRNLEALIAVARDIDPTGQAAPFFAGKDCERLDPGTALNLLEAKWAADAERHHADLSEWVSDKAVLIIPPIPPHVFHVIYGAASLGVAHVDHHHPLPHFLRDEPEIVVMRSFHAARQFIDKVNLVVFDAYRDGQTLARQSVVDLLGDIPARCPGLRLAVHFRPHPDHDGDDVALPADIVARIEEV